MALLDDPSFVLGALLSLSAAVIAVIAAAWSVASKRFATQKVLSPVFFFAVPYFAFLCLSYARPFFPIDYVPGVSADVYAEWTPSMATVGLYFLGGTAFIAGYISFPAMGRRYGGIWLAVVRPGFAAITRALRTRKVHYFILSVFALWIIGFVANVAVFVQIHGMPLVNPDTKTGIDPKLIFVAELQPILVLLAPYVFRFRSAVPSPLRPLVTPVLFVACVLASLIALALLGARNLPAKLALALLLFFLLARPRIRGEVRRNLAITGAVFLLVFVLAGVVGALTKVEIYRFSVSQLPGTVAGTPIADSLGNLYSFEAMANYGGTGGHFRGDLLWTTLLSYVPGREELYANYIVGQIVGYRPDILRSISSTFNGPALLDFGVLGLIGNSFLYGSLVSYGWCHAKESPRNLGVLSLFLATTIIDISLGTYNIWSFFSVAILVVCVEYNRII